MVVVADVLFRLTMSLPSPMLRLPVALPLMEAESLPVSELIVPEAPVLRVMVSFPAPMLRLPAFVEIVAVSLPEPRLIFSTLEKLTWPNVP